MATTAIRGDITGLRDSILTSLHDDKAEAVTVIDLEGKTSIADMMIVAEGRSTRHVASIADKLAKYLKDAGVRHISLEGMETCDWVLLDAGDVVVHIFKPGIREIYNLEKMWAVSIPEPDLTMA